MHVSDIRAGVEAAKFLAVGDIISAVASQSVLGSSVAAVNEVG